MKKLILIFFIALSVIVQAQPTISNNGMFYYQSVSGAAWDISTATYDSKSFYVGSQVAATRDIYFKSDGTKMYTIGSTSDRVYQYTLSTAWDISTASYDSKSFYVRSQDDFPYGMYFKSDGTKMYIVGSGSDRVYQYTLSTAWDISTASYDSKSFYVGSQDAVPRGIYFKSDGTKMYIAGSGSIRVHQYTLSTAWDISTATYDSKSFDYSNEVSITFGMQISTDGTQLFLGSTTRYQYTLSTAWDISTASYDSKSFDFTSESTSSRGIYIKQDGTKLYHQGGSNLTVYQYSLY